MQDSTDEQTSRCQYSDFPNQRTCTSNIATYAPVSRALPTGGSTGQIPVKTASGVAWQDAPSGGGGVQSTQIGRLIAVAEGDPLPPLSDGDMVIRYAAPVQPGAHYYANFAADTVGTAPVGWTNQWDALGWTVEADATAEASKVLRMPATSSGRYCITLDTASADPDRGDAEVLFRYKAASDANSGVTGAVRVAGDGTSETGYRGGQSSGSQMTINKYVDNVFTTMRTANVAEPFTVSGWFMCRFRVQGSTLSLKIWRDGTTEPTAWTDSVTDTSITVAGKVGVAITSNGAKYLDWVAIATGGRTAVKQ
ncbi:hypothetical protein [Rhodococcus pyridinivorans]|uniref:hypothetical protein n=1 Tax=Rhodococcus pyridinivorans TaxID=103816 RepID=UPI0039B60196